MNAPLPTADDGWIEWAGGECPVADDAMIQVQFRCERRKAAEDVAAERAVSLEGRTFRWSHLGFRADIIAYRVVTA